MYALTRKTYKIRYIQNLELSDSSCIPNLHTYTSIYKISKILSTGGKNYSCTQNIKKDLRLEGKSEKCKLKKKPQQKYLLYHILFFIKCYNNRYCGILFHLFFLSKIY